ncbi:hypothetical protein FACS1894184_15710 [Clostridia bacterium]|nr:hypothetical protein FACS1894184_15710 [Clostridia bacterium]
MKIYLYPPRCNNPYIFLMITAFQEGNYEIVDGMMGILQSNILWLNWYEGVGKPFRIFKFIAKIGILVYAKIATKKVIYVWHNKQQHNRVDLYSKILRTLQIKMSDKVVILCDETRKYVSQEVISNKMFKVLHPNYISYYSDMLQVTLQTDKLRFGYLGSIQPYKNIELLIEVFSQIRSRNIELNIYGKIYDKDYGIRLNAMMDCDDRIKLHDHFVTDEAMKKVFSNIDVFVCPLDQTSVLNSGSIMLAMSLKRTVVCPNIGTTSEFRDKDFLYTYDYFSRDVHYIRLKEKIEEVIADYNSNRNIIVEKGNKAFECVENSNSITIVTKQICDELSNTL